MKFPHAISVFAAVVFIVLGLASLLLGFSLRSLRIDVGAQERQVQAVEAQIAEQMQKLQGLEQKREWQEQANQGLLKEITHQQAAVQTQQEQISQGTAISQQLGPNLLRDMATASLKDTKLRELLAKHGYTVQTK